MAYTPVGPWTQGGAPGINKAFLDALEAFLVLVNSAATDSHISSDGNGIETLVGLIFSAGGKIVLPGPSTQSLSTGNTITIPGPLVRVTTSGNVTGIIMTAGSVANQLIFLYQSSSAGTVTFAASSSNVRGGSNTILNTGKLYVGLWDATGVAWAFTAN